jgi:hypothetical protein
MRLLPSMSGDSLTSQPGLLPPKSFRMFRCHKIAPSAALSDARSPFSERA